MKSFVGVNLWLLLLIISCSRGGAWQNLQGRVHKSRLFGDRCHADRKDFLVQTGSLIIGIVGIPTIAQAAPPKKTPPYILERGSLEGGLGPCPGQPMKKSCWSSEDTQGRRVERWEPPVSIKDDPIAIAKVLEETMAAYPQAGQNDVDKGGWKQAERNTEGKATYLRYEFTSGKFKYIDEMELLVDASGKVSVRTASRNAGFDYNVNATRLNYIQKVLEKKGWKVTLV